MKIIKITYDPMTNYGPPWTCVDISVNGGTNKHFCLQGDHRKVFLRMRRTKDRGCLKLAQVLQKLQGG